MTLFVGRWTVAGVAGSREIYFNTRYGAAINIEHREMYRIIIGDFVANLGRAAKFGNDEATYGLDIGK